MHHATRVRSTQTDTTNTRVDLVVYALVSLCLLGQDAVGWVSALASSEAGLVLVANVGPWIALGVALLGAYGAGLLLERSVRSFTRWIGVTDLPGFAVVLSAAVALNIGQLCMDPSVPGAVQLVASIAALGLKLWVCSPDFQIAQAKVDGWNERIEDVAWEYRMMVLVAARTSTHRQLVPADGWQWVSPHPPETQRTARQPAAASVSPIQGRPPPRVWGR